MALTVDRKSVESLGSKKAVVADITFDAAYPAGGEAISPSQDLGIQGVDLFMIEDAGGYHVEYVRSSKKLLVRSKAAIAAHSHTENSDVAYTQGASTSADGAVAAGALAEVAAATDLSALTVRVFVIGD